MGLKDVKDKFNRFFYRQPEEPDPEKEEEEERANEAFKEAFGENLDDGIQDGDGEKPQDRIVTVKKKALATVGAGIAIFSVVAIVNSAFKAPVTHKPEKAGELNSNSANSGTTNPANGLPDDYAQLNKYQNSLNKNGKPVARKNSKGTVPNGTVRNDVITPEEAAQTPVPPRRYNFTSDPAPSRSTPAPAARTIYVDDDGDSSGGGSGNGSASGGSSGQSDQQSQTIAKMLSSALAFKFDSSGGSTVQMPQGITPDNASDGVFTLNAGAVIPATLLTGVSSDVSNGDVVAQIRQDVYDSLTGTHLLIPQGSRVLGTSGSAGSRGNKRIGVVFKRIIFPDGRSIDLPNQNAIDGVGYPGLSDKYDDHSSSLYRSAFWTALLSAAAQSATGDSGGSDDRSPGEEAVAGAVASVLQTGQQIIQRDVNMQPTITISPGFQFSIFVNQDFSLGEYEEEG